MPALSSDSIIRRTGVSLHIIFVVGVFLRGWNKGNERNAIFLYTLILLVYNPIFPRPQVFLVFIVPLVPLVPLVSLAIDFIRFLGGTKKPKKVERAICVVPFIALSK